MNQLTFTQKLYKAGVPMVARFLDVPPQSVVVMMQHNLLDDKVNETYSQMPEDELSKFEHELTSSRSEPSSDESPRWAEIRNDYYEEEGENGFFVASIDAWKTDDEDDESGEIIAKVIGARVDGQPHVYVSYQHIDARIDASAQEAIKEAEREIRKIINQQASATKNYLIVVTSEFVRDAQLATVPEADHESDDWTDATGQLVLGTYAAQTEDQAIENAALEHHLSGDTLTAYPLQASAVKVGIRIEGGRVQSVFTDVPGAATVIDYDTDGCDEDQLVTIDDESKASVTQSATDYMPDEFERLGAFLK